MKKRSFIAALAMLVVSAIVLTSATFAWFSLGQEVSVANISVGVAQADGLGISATSGGTYGPTLSLSDIISAKQYYNFVDPANNEVMDPVSGNGLATSTWYQGHMEGDSTIISAMTRGTGTGEYNQGRFYCFPVYIKYSGASGTYATVNITNSTITNNDANKTTTGGALSAARLAVYADSQTPSTKVYVPDTTGDTAPYRYATATNTNYTNFTNGVVVTQLSGMDTISLTAGTPQKVWIVLWLEGTDEQCTDSVAAGGSICADIVFTKA